MIKSKPFISKLLFLLLCTGAFPAWSQVSPEVALQSPPIAPEFTGVTQQGYSSLGSAKGRGKKCYHFESKGSETIVIDIDVETGIVCRFMTGYYKKALRNITVSVARDKAREFLTKGGVLPDPTLSIAREDELDHGDGGRAFSFVWQRLVGGIVYPCT